MEAAVSGTHAPAKRRPKLADILPLFRRSKLERELAEAKNRIVWQRKHTERIRQRYDALERQCAALNDNVSGLRSRLWAAEQRAEAFHRVIRMFCVSAQTAEELKRIYTAVSPVLDESGFALFHAAQEITGRRLSEEFPYEDACGCFEFLDGFESLRYVEASEFGAVEWEPVPGTDCKKAVLKEVDKSSPAFREFERQLYRRVLEQLGFYPRKM